jgi:bacterioferritin-associated ferredoxin
MIVCQCEDVHEKTIRRVISAGARSIDDVTAACGAGGNCGGCWEELQELLAHHERPVRVPRWRRRLIATSA